MGHLGRSGCTMHVMHRDTSAWVLCIVWFSYFSWNNAWGEPCIGWVFSYGLENDSQVSVVITNLLLSITTCDGVWHVLQRADDCCFVGLHDSHELRTPMACIIGLLDMLLTENLSPEHKGSVRQIHRCATSLVSLLNSALDITKVILQWLYVHVISSCEVLNIICPQSNFYYA